jgi:thiamine pyrophosphokinase
MSTGDTTIIVIGGGALHPRALATIEPGAAIYAADSGYDVARDAHLEPTVLVGDLDSISVAGLAAAHARGVEIVEHPPDKDVTDTELSLDLAVHRGADRVVVMGGAGDRLDHLLGTFAALGRPSLSRCVQLEAWFDATHAQIVHPGHHVQVAAEPGATFSVLALHGDADGVDVVGAAWPLDRATLSARGARGVSNVVVSEPCTVHVTSGVLTVVIPPAVAP